MVDQLVQLEVTDGLAELILDHPPVNALSTDVVFQLNSCLDDLSGREEVQFVVVSSRGDRAFCAGADLKERRRMDREAIRDFLRMLRRGLNRLESLSVPVVAAIDGPAVGGGLELALACEVRWATPEAEFALPETQLGIIPGAGGTQRLPRAVGPARAKEMIYLGERVDAPQAQDWGLVQTLVEDFDEEKQRWMEGLEKGSPRARSLAKQAIDRGLRRGLRAGLREEWKQYNKTFDSRERRDREDPTAPDTTERNEEAG